MIITRNISGRLRESNGTRCNMPLTLRFTYDSERTPLHVNMLIADYAPERVEWSIGVDMLSAGSASLPSIGMGDIKIRRTSSGDVGICFNNDEGHAHLWLPGLPVQNLLEEIGKVDTADCLDRLVDEAIEAILNG